MGAREDYATVYPYCGGCLGENILANDVNIIWP